MANIYLTAVYFILGVPGRLFNYTRQWRPDSESNLGPVESGPTTPGGFIDCRLLTGTKDATDDAA